MFFKLGSAINMLGFGQWDHIVDHLATVSMFFKKHMFFFLFIIKYFFSYVITCKQIFGFNFKVVKYNIFL